MSAGKTRRLRRLLPSRPAIWLPVDDSLTVGPRYGLGDMRQLLSATTSMLDAVVAFRGTLTACLDELQSTNTIENLTASTIGPNHTQKSLIASVEGALSRGADGVAVHVNLTDASQPEIFRATGTVAEQADRYGLPLLIIAYPRRRRNEEADDNYEELRNQDLDSYVALLRHTVRVAAELGADVIKTCYPGDADSFRYVIDAAMGVPVVAAGGDHVDDNDTLATAKACTEAGARGTCFGRKIFSSRHPEIIVRGLAAALGDLEPAAHPFDDAGYIDGEATNSPPPER